MNDFKKLLVPCNSNVNFAKYFVVTPRNWVNFQLNYLASTRYLILFVFIEVHMNVHSDADAECRICKVPFKKSSLVFHERRFHPEIEQKERIIKALQRHISDEVSAGFFFCKTFFMN